MLRIASHLIALPSYKDTHFSLAGVWSGLGMGLVVIFLGGSVFESGSISCEHPVNANTSDKIRLNFIALRIELVMLFMSEIPMSQLM